MQVEEVLIPARDVQTLAWEGDTLVDWAGGHRRFGLDGKTYPVKYGGYGEQFDGAVISPSGNYAAVYTKLGTKGLLLRRGEILREIGRSDYYADRYEYPVALLALTNGREAIVHCPNKYCRLEIEDLETGECLAAGECTSCFHSRLAVSPNGRYLVSAGWWWHPWDMVQAYDLQLALKDPDHLAGQGLPLADLNDECNAAFMEDNRLLVALNDDDAPVPGKELRIYDLPNLEPTILFRQDKAGVGTMMPVGREHVLGLHRYPKLFELRTGSVVQEWPQIESGVQFSSFLHAPDAVPPIALDVIGKRCAIAGKRGISVLVFKS